MSWNLSLKLNNLSNYVYSLFPTSSSLIINNINTVSPGDTLTITAGTIALNGTTSIGTGNITTANITTANTTTANTTTQYLTNLGSTVSNGATINLTVPTASTANLALGILDFSTYVSMKATSASSVLIALTVPSLPNGFLANGQSITVSGVGAPWDGVYTVTYGGGITTTSNTYTLNNPSGITTGTTTTTLGTISYLNSTSNTALGTISSNGLTINNLNGKLNVVGGTSNSGNVILCNNTTSTTGNFDLLTDSNQHLKFAGGSNLLTIGGATNGGISIPSTAGTLTMATSGNIICNNYGNNGNNNVNLTAFTSGATPAITFNSRSTNSSTAIGRWGFVNNTGWNFEDGVSGGLQSTLCGVNSTGFFINNTGYFINGAKYNGLTGGSLFSSVDMVIYPNAGGMLNVIAAHLALRTGSQLFLYRPDELNYWTVGVNSSSQWVVSQSGGFAMYLLSGTAQTLWSTTSDERLKENIVSVDAVTSTLMKLKVKSYNYKSHPNAVKSIGFIAQDIQQIPELVDIMVNESPDKAEDGTHYLGVNQSVLTPYLVKAFQEQNELIVNQQKQIDNQQKQIDELKLLVNQLLNK